MQTLKCFIYLYIETKLDIMYTTNKNQNPTIQLLE